MKKKIRMTLLTALILALVCVTAAQAELIPPYGEGQIGLGAVVLCENLTIRREPATNSGTVQTLHAGDRFSVLKQENGWAQCVLSDDVDAGPVGWVNAEYIKIDPAWFRTEKATPVYAWGDTAAPKVALLDGDTLLPVLKAEGDWLVVGLRGASGWIQFTAAD